MNELFADLRRSPVGIQQHLQQWRGTIIKDHQEDDSVSIIKSLLEGEQNAKERAVAWLELQGVKL